MGLDTPKSSWQAGIHFTDTNPAGILYFPVHPKLSLGLFAWQRKGASITGYRLNYDLGGWQWGDRNSRVYLGVGRADSSKETHQILESFLGLSFPVSDFNSGHYSLVLNSELSLQYDRRSDGVRQGFDMNAGLLLSF